ncbi:MAG: lytic murein transglycosylase B [Proteobacteria bacterium]|nr:lytic murein transglycosylase B [Pseudomonadota bacterium]
MSLIFSFYLSTSFAKVNLKDVDAFIKQVSTEHDLDAKWVRSILAQANHQQSVINAMNKPAEKTLKWYQYRKIFITDKRIKEGVDFWQTHQPVLEEISQKSGVPIEIIVAIIGVETFYGRIKGNDKVLDALYTLAFDYPKRSKFFTSELKHFLLLAQEHHIDPLSAKGSYAGAMGYGQFMPSSYRAYAVDYENDNQIDLINNPKDAIASVANYLAEHKWLNGGRILEKSHAAKSDIKYNQLKLHLLDEQLNLKYTLLKLDLENNDKEYWAGYQNFYAISRYNHSHMYVMAVFQLAESIKTKYSQK